MRIYVAGPYSAETAEGRLANTELAMLAGLAIMDKGHAPFVPHLTHFMDELQFINTGSYRSWEEWMCLDNLFLEQCDGLLFLGPSRGANIERENAEFLGLEIFESLDQIPNVD